MEKAAGPTGVVSEMMRPAGGFGSRWMTDLINNIVKEGCFPDDWRKSILVSVKKAFDIVPREMMRWALRKLGVDEWLIRTVMA